MTHGLEIIIAINKMEDPDRYMLQSAGIVKIYRAENAKMAKQGNCPKCKIQFVWDKDVLQRFTWCPECGDGPLLPNTHALSWPTRRVSHCFFWRSGKIT